MVIVVDPPVVLAAKAVTDMVASIATVKISANSFFTGLFLLYDQQLTFAQLNANVISVRLNHIGRINVVVIIDWGFAVIAQNEPEIFTPID